MQMRLYLINSAYIYILNKPTDIFFLGWFEIKQFHCENALKRKVRQENTMHDDKIVFMPFFQLI